ncbi:MAG: sigma-70 family RNA polymerase sigma factor [Pseudomonadota bacterium]
MSIDKPTPSESEQPGITTTALLDRANSGDEAARDALFQRVLPMLRRFARGRLPAWGRDSAETEDLVQITLLRAFKRLGDFKAERPGAFLSYLRTIMMNAVRDEIRKKGRRPHSTSSVEEAVIDPESVVANVVGMETIDAYEGAMAELNEGRREAVMMHVEFGMTYAEVALELGLPSANAARMRIKRGLEEVARLMP